MSLYLENFAKSVDILERSVRTAGRIDDSDEDLKETVRAGVIQHFEVAYELSWKMIQKWLKENISSDVNIPKKALFKELQNIV